MHTHIKIDHKKSVTDPAPNTIGYKESGTNADTCCLGKNCIPIAYTNQKSDIYPYSEAYEPI